MGARILRDEAKDRNITEKAKAVAHELGLEMLPVADFGIITAAEWKALVQLPAMKRFVGSLCEAFVVAIEAEEVARVKHRTMRGLRPGARNNLAKDAAVGQIRAEAYHTMLRGLAFQANRTT